METSKKTVLRTLIEERIASVRLDICAYREAAKPVAPDNAIGRLSRMEAINSKAMAEAALRQAEQTLTRLELAVAQIDKEDFGLCIDCEEPIAFERLKVRPESIRCVHCAS